ncbi:MAG: O-antigen ligase family protein [Bacteroidota bacterium]
MAMFKLKDLWNRWRAIDYHQRLGVISLLTLFGGIFFSRAMMSMGMIGLAFNFAANNNILKNLSLFWKNKALVAITTVLLVYLLSGVFSENTDWYVDRLRMKLPFLMVPISIVAIPRMDKKVYFPLLYLFFFLCVVLSAQSLLQYFTNYEDISVAYERGKILPTPVQHIRFSLMVAFSVAIGWYLYQKEYALFYKWEKWLQLGGSLFLILFLHVLAVRSGLVALYGVLAFFLIQFFVVKKKYLLGIGIAVALAIGAFMAYQFLPSLNNKVRYTVWSVKMFIQNQELRELSDSRRLASIQAGVEMIKKHPLTGVGIGDVRDETNNYMKEHYPSLVDLELMPHNQYIFVWAATGTLGLIAFVWATFMPLIFLKGYRDSLLVAFSIIIFSSFLVEHTVETQLGTAFYILFVSLGCWYWYQENATIDAKYTTNN